MKPSRCFSIEPKLPGVRRIAVLRSNSLGDYIFSLPALEALAAAYPRAEIVLLGKPWHAGFLQNRPGPVHRVKVLPFVKGVCETPGSHQDDTAVRAFVASCRKERFDICCQLYGGGRFSNPFTASLGARLTVGMKAADADDSCLDRWVPYIYYFPEVMRYLEVAALCGAPPVTLKPRLHVTRTDLREAERAYPYLRERFVVLHPGATDTRRRWPAKKFGEVASKLAAKGVRVCVTGSGDEAYVCAQTARASGGRAMDLFGRLSLSGLAGLLSKAALVVANDTGPLHLARAVGTATVAVYWVGNYINAGPPDMASHRSHISWQLECPACGTNCITGSCGHGDSFVSEIPVAPVFRSCLDILSRR